MIKQVLVIVAVMAGIVFGLYPRGAEGIERLSLIVWYGPLALLVGLLMVKLVFRGQQIFWSTLILFGLTTISLLVMFNLQI